MPATEEKGLRPMLHLTSRLDSDFSLDKADEEEYREDAVHKAVTRELWYKVSYGRRGSSFSLSIVFFPPPHCWGRRRWTKKVPIGDAAKWCWYSIASNVIFLSDLQ